MNLNKHLEVFDPSTIDAPIHIIGCGAIGSTIAELLTRLGVQSLHLYDFDTVTDHNITNQMYRFKDIGEHKVVALTDILKEINPDIKIVQHLKGYNSLLPITGYVFLAVDSIELRKQFITQHRMNKLIKYVADFRMEVKSAQTYAAVWDDDTAVESLWKSMQFTEEEAKAATPVSACGTTLSITPAPRAIVTFGVSNFIEWLLTGAYKTMMMVNPFTGNVIAFPE